ncbi:hypothetical protein ACFFQW_05135 [Umezawaea endophytica]|uniref:Uncharacterized protein n=1 Tax=Umezawaea endophytica TaxID=1654476 RepID=A0A9X2VHI8_9PSEU|nr:hypothetical protein [Umezawaea endophytica]MCS7476244.1 hypothetical protein [Umezawaea endophytica]
MRAQCVESHPGWPRAVIGRLASEVRRVRRRTWLVRHGNKVVTGLALLAVVALGVGLRATLGPTTEPAPAASPTAITKVDLTDPFRGTPATYWPDGEAGLVVPPAAAIGTFSAEQVAEAYAKARTAVVAARLDRRVVEGHDVEPLLGLFALDDQEGLRPLFAGGRDDEAGLVATRIAPGTALLPVQPKVSGKMTIEAKSAGELVVHTDYVFAYAFSTDDVGKLNGPMDIVAVTRIQYDYIMRSGPTFRAESQGMWSGPSTEHSYSIGCAASREGFLAPSFTEPRSTHVSTLVDGKPDDYFDPSKPMPTINTCPG